jgi:hypothetical protein
MTAKDPRPGELQRLRYTSGQMLRSGDFRDQLANDAQLRWWHNRALHNSYGIACGMQVELTRDNAAVVVMPGLAYDSFGRELLLRERRTHGLPDNQAPMTLLARYRDDAGTTRPHPDRCPPGGETTDDIELLWREPRRVGLRDGVPLQLLTYANDVPTLLPAARRARPLARPRIGYGATLAGATPWTLWALPAPRLPVVLGIQARIDTGAAGFTEVPCYFAWLQWPRFAPSQGLSVAVFSFALQYVDEAAIDGFVFRVVLPVQLSRLVVARPRRKSSSPIGESSGEELLGFAHGQQLSVCWLGVQVEHSAPAGPHKGA